MIAPVEEGKDEDPEKKVLDKNQSPEFVVILEGKDDFFKARIK